MSEAELKSTQLDALAFGRGPGSFTGLRLAAGVAQGIALAADLPVIPVSTLAVIAQTTFRKHGEPKVLVAVDARMREIYWSEFEVNSAGLMLPVQEERVSGVDSVSLRASVLFGAGSGFRAFPDELQAHLQLHLKDYDETVWPRAEDLLPLAEYSFLSGEYVSAAEAVPIYIRDDVAHKKSI